MSEAMIIEEKLETAKEFLETLRNSNQRWTSKQNKWETAWIFRGQPDSNLPLIPSAWRTKKLDRFKEKYKAKFENILLIPFEKELEAIAKLIESGEIEENKGKEQANFRSFQTNWAFELSLQYFAEMQAVKEFSEFADQLGYPVPGANEFINYNQANFNKLTDEDYLIELFAGWTEHSDPFRVNCSVVALAQHHGVPTRLLDWTENPLIAAFFAAEEFTSDEGRTNNSNLHEDRIAVWAISKEIFTGKESDRIHPSPLQLIIRPRHEIGYLLAQKAVFTLDKSANEHYTATGQWRSVEEAIDNNPEYLKKLTLPVKEVGELLRLLWLEGISRAHLMPTYDNVTRALQTKAWWENRNR